MDFFGKRAYDMMTSQPTSLRRLRIALGAQNPRGAPSDGAAYGLDGRRLNPMGIGNRIGRYFQPD